MALPWLNTEKSVSVSDAPGFKFLTAVSAPVCDGLRKIDLLYLAGDEGLRGHRVRFVRICRFATTIGSVETPEKLPLYSAAF